MLLLEHQGKSLLRRYGIATPSGVVIESEAALAEAFDSSLPVVLKAQVAAGGRGKAGGILFARDAGEALAAYRTLRRMTVGGHAVETVLVEERTVFAHERYAAIQIENGRLWLLFGAGGGVDIETITAGNAANIQRIEVSALDGPDAKVLRRAFAALGIAEAFWPAYEAVAHQLFRLTRDLDIATAEINPLVETTDGRLIALDARMFPDETALGRQQELAALVPAASEKSTVAMPSPSFKTNPEGGSIGLIGFGSGLNITFMDWVERLGGKVGRLVDIDAMVTGGHGEAGFAAAFAHMDQSPDIRTVLLCIISCGNRMDDIVRAMRAALANRSAQAKPVTFYLRGNRMSHAEEMLEAGRIKNSPSLAAALTGVVAASKAGAP